VVSRRHHKIWSNWLLWYFRMLYSQTMVIWNLGKTYRVFG